MFTAGERVDSSIYQFHKFTYQAYAKNFKNRNVNLTQISVHDPKDSTGMETTN